LKSIVFTVCEHEYMNMSPHLSSLATPLPVAETPLYESIE
jgi:hypothetical protein